MQALTASFWSSSFLPHGYCLQWNPSLLWTLAVSDALIALAYFSIPFALWYFAKNRPDIRHRWLFVLFGLFIISCGITHLLDVFNLWRPNYGLSAASRTVTALLSVITAVMLWRIMPDALRAPSMQQLEQRVAQRTQALENANALLQESEARFRNLANAAPVLIWLAGPDGLCSWFNQTWLEYTGRRLEEELGEGWAAGVHPDDLAQCLDTYRTHFAARQPFQMEYRLRGRDGRYRWFIDVGRPRLDEQGEFAGYLGILTDIDQRKQLEESLRLRQFSLDNASEEVFWIDQHGRFLDANAAACRKLGYSREEMLKLSVADVDADFPFDRWPQHWQALREQGSLQLESMHKTRDDRVYPVEIIANYFEYAGTQYNCALVRDISERKALELAIREQSSYLNAILDSEPECVKVLARDGGLLEMNRAGLEMLQVDSLQEAREIGLANFVQPEFRPLFIKLQRDVLQGKRATLEFLLEGKHGRRLWVDTHAAPLFDDDGQVRALVAVTRDVTERVNLLKELAEQAHRDALTGLANRRHFLEQAELELSRARRYDKVLSVMMLDVDHFKEINDSHGHKTGDLVLQKLAEACRVVLREVDLIGRIGGEEFAILLPETPAPQAREVAERMRRQLEAIQITLPQQEASVRFTVSIGVTALSASVASVDSLLQSADAALYQAKHAGRNCVVMAQTHENHEA